MSVFSSNPSLLDQSLYGLHASELDVIPEFLPDQLVQPSQAGYPQQFSPILTDQSNAMGLVATDLFQNTASGIDTEKNYPQYLPLQIQQVLEKQQATAQLNPLTGQVELHVTQQGIDQAGQMVFGAMGNFYGDMSSGEVVNAQLELQRIQAQASLSGIPVNVNDLIQFVSRQMNIMHSQYNSMASAIQKSADNISRVGDTISSAYQKTIKTNKKASEPEPMPQTKGFQI